MLPFLLQETQDELIQLAERYGQPIVREVDLGTTNQFDPLNNSDRYGEVCMVVRRRNGRLLTMKKTFYPAGAFRLLTGGIHHGEHVLDALLRETEEETGLDVRVQRFLVAVAYRTTNTGQQPAFYTFAFLLDELGGTLATADEEERVEAFREILPEELPERAIFFEQVRVPGDPEVTDWGHFRAVIHRLVWEALQN